jgi:endonuclease/exonuclease/phosphatase family metal-dependent hydrolase
MTFNLLAHAYTKYAKAHHRNPTGHELESSAQRQRRRLCNAAVVAAFMPDVLCTQEHDKDLDIVGYEAGVRASVEGRGEGCAVLFRSGSVLSQQARRTWTVDLREGKTAAFAHLPGHAVFVSVHLKGGPDSDAVKRRQLAAVLEMLPTEPRVVVCGEMNEPRPEALFADCLAAHGLKRVHYEGFSGMSSDYSVPLHIDHMFVRQSAVVQRASVLGHPMSPWLPEASSGSDHVPLVATIQAS